MKSRYQFIIYIFLFLSAAKAQETIYPVKDFKGVLFITHATIHVGNGQVILNGTIQVNEGKIEKIGTDLPVSPGGAKVIDATGKQVYPGLISSNTDLGLKEVASGVRGANDYNELGEINPSIRSIVAYNTDSKVINVLRSNGILLANIIPQNAGGSSNVLITGTSSVVQLDAWNWEDAVYKMDGNMHLNIPSLEPRSNQSANPAGNQPPQPDPIKTALDQIEKIKVFFREAKGYLDEAVHKETNLKFEATKDLFHKKQKLFIHCDAVKEILLALDFVTEFNFDIVIVGGRDSWQIADLLTKNNVAVVLDALHSLPFSADDDVDQPFKTPYLLQKAKVLFAISDADETTRGRNLAFNAGTAAAYGLSKEEALGSVTLNAAKILGIAGITGSLEAGKDANIVISEGDILDVKSSIITNAFIQGREIDLTNKQTQLYERYKYKYGLK